MLKNVNKKNNFSLYIYVLEILDVAATILVTTSTFFTAIQQVFYMRRLLILLIRTKHNTLFRDRHRKQLNSDTTRKSLSLFG